MLLERKILLSQLVLHIAFMVFLSFILFSFSTSSFSVPKQTLGGSSFILLLIMAMTMDPMIQWFFISDSIILALCAGIQLFIGTFLLLQTISTWRLREPPERCNTPCVWFLFILASAIVLGLSITLSANIDDKSDLRNTLENEATRNISDGLLNFGYQNGGCCGIDKTDHCLQSFPPMFNATDSYCPRGSEKCQNVSFFYC